MKKIWNVFKKHWITVWLFTALAAFCSLIIVAAYTEVSSVKRVVSTQASPSVMFSSNCMRKVTSMRRLSSNAYTITVCNFDQDKPTIYNPSTINYKLYAEIMVKVNDRYYTMSELQTVNAAAYNEYVGRIEGKYFISKTYDDTAPNTLITDNSYSFGFNAANNFKVLFPSYTLSPHDDSANETLAAQHSSVDRFKVEIDNSTLSSENPDIFVHVWAEATDNSLGTIETMLYGAAETMETATWTGSMLETNCATVDYDFYNYIISGSGSGTVDILWDPNKFEINPFFFNDPENNFANNNNTPAAIAANDTVYGQNAANGDYTGWKKVTISVNSIVKNRYELQLYKTASEATYTGQQNRADNFIKCFFNG